MIRNSESLIALIDRLTSGAMTREEFLAALADDRRESDGFAPVGDFAQADMERAARTGIPEFIYAPGKTAEQIAAIAAHMTAAGMRNVLATKVSRDTAAAVCAIDSTAVHHEECGVLVFHPDETRTPAGCIAIVTAGTADLPLAREAELVCHALGSRTVRIADVGVAGIRRVFDALPRLEEARVVICVAGMEGALPSVVAGLVPVPVIALPASTGYGVNTGGFNALLSSLGSCVPGLVVVNIDNGVGAAAAAHRINMLSERAR